MATQTEIVEGHRKRIFESDDRTFYLHVGYFMAWYSACEARITLLLAIATKSENLKSFDLLTRGMDAKVKIERFRLACNGYRKIGDNLKRRLAHFEKKIIPLRNKIAHSHMTTDPSYQGIHFASLSKMPLASFGLYAVGEAPPYQTFREIFEQGLWLNVFNDDLLSVWKNAAHPTEFEIDDPVSPLPPTGHPPSPPSVPPSTPNKRARKRLRKGQPARGKKAVQRG